jgi:PEP-CTERM motif
MQKMLRRILIVIAGLAGMIPPGVDAMTLEHIPVGAPICLSTDAPTACNGGGASLHDYSFTFDFSGIVGTDEIITAATLLNVFDDSGRADGSDKIDVFLDTVDMGVNGDVQNDILLLLSDLGPLSDGFLTVLLQAHTGDFFFGGATLTLTVEDRPQDPAPDPIETTSSVPLPASLVLVGLGLATLAARRRV